MWVSFLINVYISCRFVIIKVLKELENEKEKKLVMFLYLDYELNYLTTINQFVCRKNLFISEDDKRVGYFLCLYEIFSQRSYNRSSNNE